MTIRNSTSTPLAGAGTLLAAALVVIAVAGAGACGGAEAEPESPADPADEPADEPVAEPDAEPEEDDGAVAAGPDALEQAARGADVYDAECAFCHGDDGEGAGANPAVVGDDLLANYAHAGELLDYVAAEMPETDPGGLAAEDFEDVVAFLLDESGVDLAGHSVSAGSASDIDL